MKSVSKSLQQFLEIAALCLACASASGQQLCSDFTAQQNEILSVPTSPSSGQQFLVKILGNRSAGSNNMLAGMTVTVTGNTVIVNAKLNDQIGSSASFCYTSVTGPLAAGKYTLQFFAQSGNGAGVFGPPVLVATLAIDVVDPAAIPTMNLLGMVILAIGLLTGALAMLWRRKCGATNVFHEMLLCLTLPGIVALATTFNSDLALAETATLPSGKQVDYTLVIAFDPVLVPDSVQTAVAQVQEQKGPLFEILQRPLGVKRLMYRPNLARALTVEPFVE